MKEATQELQVPRSGREGINAEFVERVWAYFETIIPDARKFLRVDFTTDYFCVKDAYYKPNVQRRWKRGNVVNLTAEQAAEINDFIAAQKSRIADEQTKQNIRENWRTMLEACFDVMETLLETQDNKYMTGRRVKLELINDKPAIIIRFDNGVFIKIHRNGTIERYSDFPVKVQTVEDACKFSDSLTEKLTAIHPLELECRNSIPAEFWEKPLPAHDTP